MNLEKVYVRVNTEALWQVLRMHDVGSKLLNGIKSMYVNSLTCVKVKRGESECFRIDIGVRPLTFQCIYRYAGNDEGGENGNGEEEKEWKILVLLYADDLVLCGESEEDLKVMVKCFVEVCRRRGMKVNADRRKGMVLSGKEGLE